MAAPPASIRVGPFRYTVLFDGAKVREFEHEKQNAYSGYSDHAKLEIAIDPTLAAEAQAETLWHEVKHCVCHLFGWESKKTEEEAVRQMAPMELAVLRDNPELVAFLLEAGPTRPNSVLE